MVYRLERAGKDLVFYYVRNNIIIHKYTYHSKDRDEIEEKHEDDPQEGHQVTVQTHHHRVTLKQRKFSTIHLLLISNSFINFLDWGYRITMELLTPIA